MRGVESRRWEGRKRKDRGGERRRKLERVQDKR